MLLKLHTKIQKFFLCFFYNFFGTSFVLLFVLFGSSCSKSATDPYAKYKGQEAKVIFASTEHDLYLGKYSAAVKDLTALEYLYPASTYNKQMLLDLIYAYYKNADYDESIQSANRYIRLYPDDKHLDYVYYMLGIDSFEVSQSWLYKYFDFFSYLNDQTNLTNSYNYFSKLFDFENSMYYEPALSYMCLERNLLALHDMDVAQFYMEKHAYVASINRANEVLVKYNGSNQTKLALDILSKSYAGIGMNDTAAKVTRLTSKSICN